MIFLSVCWQKFMLQRTYILLGIDRQETNITDGDIYDGDKLSGEGQ